MIGFAVNENFRPADNATLGFRSLGIFKGRFRMRAMQHMEEMNSMAQSMKSMTAARRMMIEKEMRNAPLRIGSIIGVGSLFEESETNRIRMGRSMFSSAGLQSAGAGGIPVVSGGGNWL